MEKSELNRRIVKLEEQVAALEVKVGQYLTEIIPVADPMDLSRRQPSDKGLQE